MGHVTAVFVSEPWWGTGVATEILAWLVDDMRAMGYGEGRLYTPVGQTRARAFYAREGWREVAGPLPAPELGLDIMELRWRCLGWATRRRARRRRASAARP